MTEQRNIAEKKQLLDEDCQKCRESLTSLFDASTAEYFLSSTSFLKQTPPWFSQLKDDMKDHISAVALWDALRHRSVQILQESETEKSFENINEISRRVTDWRSQIKQDHVKHLTGVKNMFQCAQRNQALSALLLQQNPPIGYGTNDG